MSGRLRASCNHRDRFCWRMPVCLDNSTALRAFLPVRRSIIFCLKATENGLVMSTSTFKGGDNYPDTGGQVSALFEYPHDEIIGRRIEDLMPERFRDRHVLHRENYFDSVRLRPMGLGLELYGRRRDGTEFPLEIS